MTIVASIHRTESGSPLLWLFDLVPETEDGHGWRLIVGPARRAKYELAFSRTYFMRGKHVPMPTDRYFWPDLAYVTRAGIVHLPDTQWKDMEFEDRVALEAILRALPDHPPFDSAARANPARTARVSPDAFVAGATLGRKRGPKPGGQRRGVIDDDARATMHAMRDAGATYQAIADAVGVSKVAVWKRMQR